MSGVRDELERMRAARQRLAQARQRVRRLSWMARSPEDLDAEVPLLTKQAFARALARFQAIRLQRETAMLLMLRVAPCDSRLRQAVAMHLIENTRNCDTLGCAGPDTFLVLLKDADEEGAQAAATRLHDDLRQLAAQRGLLVCVQTKVVMVTPQMMAHELLWMLDTDDGAVSSGEGDVSGQMLKAR